MDSFYFHFMKPLLILFQDAIISLSLAYLLILNAYFPSFNISILDFSFLFIHLNICYFN